MEMTSYQELYGYPFAQMADAVEELKAGRTAAAAIRLVEAQREAEERVLAEEDIPDRPTDDL